MQDADNKKRIIFIILGIIIFLLIVFLIFKMFTPKEYSIKFDSNGGSKVNGLVVKKDGVIPKPEDPTRDGYNFAGWYYENKLFDFNTKVKEEMVLKAKWVEDGKVNGVSLNIGTLSLQPDGTYTLVATITPDNANNTNLRWTSSDESIATVDENGKINAISEGKVIITVTTEDGEYTAQCEVTVTIDIVSVTDVTISGKSEVEVGKTIKLTATVSPKDASNNGVTWKSSNTKIATVDKNGNVKGIKSGKVTITVTTEDGSKTAKKEITVKEATSTQEPSITEEDVKVTGIKIKGDESRTMYVGDTLTLEYEITPSNAKNKNVKWESNKPKVVKVENGKITALAKGEATIIVTSEDGNVQATIKIVVNEKVKEDVYVLYLTPKHQSGTGDVEQYTYRLTKNNETFTDYNGFIFNGHTTKKNAGSIRAIYVEGATSKTADLYLEEKSSPIKITVVIEN